MVKIHKRPHRILNVTYIDYLYKISRFIASDKVGMTISSGACGLAPNGWIPLKVVIYLHIVTLTMDYNLLNRVLKATCSASGLGMNSKHNIHKYQPNDLIHRYLAVLISKPLSARYIQ